MPLVGGGGAGNVSGGNPSGTGTGLNYIGNHAYGYSGKIEATNAQDFIMLHFTTGNEYIKGSMQFYYAEDTSDDMIFSLKINSELVFSYLVTNPVSAGASSNQNIDIIIPPFSNIEILAKNGSSSTARDVYATISGRVYA